MWVVIACCLQNVAFLAQHCVTATGQVIYDQLCGLLASRLHSSDATLCDMAQGRPVSVQL